MILNIIDHINEKCWRKTELKLNLSIADILYSGHLLITDTFSRNGLIKILIENLCLADTSLQRTNFLGPNGVRYIEVLLY